MTNIAVGSGTSPAPMGLLARFVGVITSPRATFASVAAHPKVLGMLLLTTVIVAAGAALPMTTEAGRQAALDQQVSQMEAFGMQVSDEQYEGMRKGMRIAPYTAAGGVLIMSPVMALIFAGILFAVFNAALGGEASFKQILAVCVHAGAVSALGYMLAGPFNYFRGAITSPTSLGVLLPMLDDASFAGRLMGMVDIFVIWWLLALAIGLAVLYKRRTQPIAMTFYGIYALIIVCLAAFMSR